MFRENSQVQTDLNGPLLSQKSDKGSYVTDQSGVDGILHSDQRQLIPKVYCDLPNQIQINKGTFNKLGLNHPFPKEVLHHEYFAQARFLIPSERFQCESDLQDMNINQGAGYGGNGDFDLEKLTKFMISSMQTQDTNPMVKTMPEFLCGPHKEIQPFEDVLNYESQEQIEDLSKDDKYFKKYIQKWTNEVQTQKILRIGKNEPIAIDKVTELYNAIVHDQNKIDGTNIGMIRESLHHAGSLNSTAQLIKLRKSLYPITHSDKNLGGKLKLEMTCIQPSGELKQMGQTVLSQFTGTEEMELFNSNCETLFGHIQVRDLLYFFNVENQEAKHIIKLNKFQINDNAKLDSDSQEEFSIDLQAEQHNRLNEGSKLIGVTMIQALWDQEDQEFDRIPSFFFALVFGKVGDQENELIFDIRHSTKHSISLYEKKLIQRKDKGQAFKENQPFIIHMPAEKVFFQMLQSGIISEEAMGAISQKAKVYTSINLSQRNSTKGKSADQLLEGIKDLSLFVFGRDGDLIYDQIEDSFFMAGFGDEDQSKSNRFKTLKSYKKETLMVKQDIQSMEEMLQGCLKMLTKQHTCNIVNFNSAEQVPEMSQKIDCRGQIELIRRMLITDYSEPQMLAKQSELFSQIGQSEIENHDCHKINPDDHDDEEPKIRELNKYLLDYSCASLIDNINCQMIMLLYHRQDVSKQFLITFKQQNIAQVCNQDIFDDKKPTKLADIIQQTGYNQLLLKIFSKYQVDKQDKLTQKIVLSRRFSNVARDSYKIYWLQEEKLKCTNDEDQTFQPLRSRFQIMHKSNPNQDKIIEQHTNKDQFIYALVNDLQYTDKKNKYSYDVDEFQNYSNNLPRNQVQGNVKEMIKVLTDELEYKIIKKGKNLNQDSFKLQGKYLMLQNIITVEDDREDIPVVSIGKGLKGVQFAMLQYDQIRAITSLNIDYRLLQDNCDFKEGINRGNYHQVIQFCASSDVLVGQEIQDDSTVTTHIQKNELKINYYFYQNFTVAVFYQKLRRFEMYEYQVKWRPNTDPKTSKNQLYNIEINLIKLRDVIFEKAKLSQSIKGFTLVPLYENLETKFNTESIIDDGYDKKAYQITGVKLILKTKDKQRFVDFRSLLNSKLYNIKDQYKQINYKKKYVMSRTKLIKQHLLSGAYVETQFKHRQKGILTSDYINSTLFDDQQSFEILKEANMNAFNSLPIDYVALMDVPEIIDKWFQSLDRQASNHNCSKSALSLNDLMYSNLKRYFNACELNDGHQIFEQYGNIDESQDNYKMISNPKKLGDCESNIKCDPSKTRDLFKKINQQYQDRYWDFKFVMNIRNPLFAKSLIERVIANDHNVYRMSQFMNIGLLQDGKDILTSNFDQQSIIQGKLQGENIVMKDICLKQLFMNDYHTENNYRQLMRLLPVILKIQFNEASDTYFKFFKDQELPDKEEEFENHQYEELECLFGKIQRIQETQGKKSMIKFNQQLPDNLQDQLNLYNNEEIQVFQEDSKSNSKNLTYSNPIHQVFNLLQQQYSSNESQFEVRASYINFKPLILGQKIFALEKAKNPDDFEKIAKKHIDSYELSLIINKIIQLTKGSIEEQSVIRDIVDWQYITSQSYFEYFLKIYTMFYLIPLVIQMLCTDPSYVFGLNMCCLVCQILLLLYELMTISETGIKVYLKNKLNWIDLLNCGLYYFYFYMRMQNMELDLIPSLDPNLKGTDKETFIKHQNELTFKKYCPFIHTMLILCAFIKLLYFLRCNQQMSRLVQLVVSTVYDIRFFILFFVSWIFVFAHLFKITGADFDDGDYALIPQLKFVLQIFRNTIGDVAAPQYEYWQELHNSMEEKSSMSQPMLVIYTIWILWFLNLLFNMIILLNFLIAIISQVYDKIISSSLVYEYEHKSEMNMEIQRFLHQCRLLKPFDVMSIVSRQDVGMKQNNEVLGLTNSMKRIVRSQLGKLQDDVNVRFNRFEMQLVQNDKEIRNQLVQNDKEIKNYIDERHRQLLQQILRKIESISK